MKLTIATIIYAMSF